MAKHEKPVLAPTPESTITGLSSLLEVEKIEDVL